MTCAARFSTLAHEAASGDKPIEAWVRVGRKEERRKKRAAGSRRGKIGLLLLGLRWASTMAEAALAARGGKVVVCLLGGRLPMCDKNERMNG